jgi:hypothetical protein
MYVCMYVCIYVCIFYVLDSSWEIRVFLAQVEKIESFFCFSLIKSKQTRGCKLQMGKILN